MADYSYITNNATFQPFSLQEMMTPFLMYKDAFEKAENSYEELSKADEFKYLDETIPEGSKARGIYDRYAKDLNAASEDLAHNGLNMSNRRAVTSLRKRYVGEIGRLQKANAALEEAKKFNKTLDAQDPSRIHAIDTSNLTIDDYLDGKTPNEYSVSGNDLYAKAAAASKGISARKFFTGEAGRLFNNYYIDYVQKRGFSQEEMDAFYRDASKIPALKAAMDDILEATGAKQNLTGDALRRAGKYVLRGIMDNAIYEEQHSPQRDLGMIDASTQAQLNLTKRGQDISLATNGMTYDDRTGTVTYDPKKDPQLQKAAAITAAKKAGGSSGSGQDPYMKGTYYYSHDANGNYEKLKEGKNIPKTAIPVHIKVENGQYVASVGEGDDEVELGRINSKGTISNLLSLSDHEATNKMGKLNKGRYRWESKVNKEDISNIEKMLKDIVYWNKHGGDVSHQNYLYHLDLDTASWSNEGGGFYRTSLDRSSPTIFNSDPNEALNTDAGFGDKPEG